MKLLLDLTPLDSPARHRGNGRYLRELALGLSDLPASALGQLELLALTHLDPGGGFRVTDQLRSFSGSPERSLPTSRDHYHWTYARRFGLWRAVRRIGAEAVHFGDPNATPLFMHLTSCRRILTCHDTIPMRYPRRYMGLRDGGPLLGRAIERRRYRAADVVIAVSDATRDDACTFYGLSPDRVVRVYNGVDIERWSRAPAPLDAESTLRRWNLFRQSFALYVGGPDWHKNIEGMVGGLAHARRRGVDVVLAWAGVLNTSHRERVLEIARRAGVADRVRFLGWVGDDDLAVLYRAARAHVLLSRCEGFGLTVVEAMACGCPVITTARGSLGEVAADAALLVEPDDHEAIGASLARLCREPGLRDTLAEWGRLRAPRFSRRLQAEGTLRVYRNLLEPLTDRLPPSPRRAETVAAPIGTPGDSCRI